MTLSALEALIAANSDLETPCPVQDAAHQHRERMSGKSQRNSCVE